MNITIHEALSKLKLYDARIRKASEAEFVSRKSHASTKVKGVDEATVKETLVANKQSLVSLLANRKALKDAIAMSNATTKITVSGNEYTVVEAIERKHFAETELNTISRIERQYEAELRQVNAENLNLDARAEAYISSILGSDKQCRPTSEIDAMKKKYKDDQTMELVDPCDITTFVKNWRKEVEDFRAEVDFKLSVSNATTIITVELLGV